MHLKYVSSLQACSPNPFPPPRLICSDGFYTANSTRGPLKKLNLDLDDDIFVYDGAALEAEAATAMHEVYKVQKGGDARVGLFAEWKGGRWNFTAEGKWERRRELTVRRLLKLGPKMGNTHRNHYGNLCGPCLALSFTKLSLLFPLHSLPIL